MRKNILLSVLFIWTTALSLQAQELAPRRTSAKKAEKMVRSERFAHAVSNVKRVGGILQQSASDVITPDWECNFDKASDFDQFTVLDLNDDAFQSSHFKWGTWDYLYRNGETSPYGDDYPDHCAAYTNSEDYDGDDWLITPGLQLKGGATYVVKYKVRAHRSSMVERMEVKYGSAATAAAMTTTLLAATNFTNTEYQELSQTITVPTDQVVYIGFHALSDTDDMLLYLDDISVKKSETGFKGWECNFDKATDFDQFTVLDLNNDAFQSSHFKWGTWDYLYRDGGASPYGDEYPDHCAAYTNSEDNDGDDWLITPALSLKAGETYVLKYKVRAHRSSMVERMEVKYGTAATAAAMTTTLLAATNFTNTEYQELSQTITPTADGDYYIGFHALSDTDDMLLYLDDISVKKQGALPPGAVTDLSVTPDADGALKATLQFTAPSTATDGSTLKALTGIKVLENDVEVADLTTAKAGEQTSVTVASKLTAPGTATYTLIPYNADGNGTKVTKSAWIGLDVPTAPAKVSVSPSGDKLNVTWDAAKAQHEGAFKADQVTYSVNEMRDANTVENRIASVTGTTSTTANIDFYTGTQRMVQIAVMATNATGSSAYTFASPLVVGKPYALPFKEAFAKAGNAYDYWGAEGTGWGYQNNYAGVTFTTDEDANGDGGSADIKTYYEDCVSLVSGKISIEGATKPVLMFSQKTSATDGSIRPFVITADGSKEYLATESLKNYADADKWTSRSYDLSAYKEQAWIQVGVMFDQSQAMYRNRHLYIDNIVVANEKQQDVAVAIMAPAKLRKGRTTQVTITATNYGQAIDNYQISLAEGDKEVKVINVTEPLAQMATATYNIAYTPSVLTEGETANLKATFTTGDGSQTFTTDASTQISMIDAHQPAATQLTATATNSAVALTWTGAATMDKMTDDFEDYNPWSISNVGDWSFIDGDKGVTYGYFDEDGLYYENEKTPFAFIVWTPSNYGGEDITHANPTATPASGLNAMGSVYSYNRNAQTGELTPLDADNWMISPELTGRAQTISFKVNNITASHPEDYQVLYSTTGKEVADFHLIASKTVSDCNWSTVDFDLPEGSKYFAIRHTTKLTVSSTGIGYSSAPYLLLVDDVTFASTGCTLMGYNVYRDGQLVTSTTQAQYTDTAAPHDGESHTYQVTATYADGSESTPVTAFVTIPTGIDIVENGSTKPDTIYTLDGCKMDAGTPLHRGIYIKNGKKVIVR